MDFSLLFLFCSVFLGYLSINLYIQSNNDPSDNYTMVSRQCTCNSRVLSTKLDNSRIL